MFHCHSLTRLEEAAASGNCRFFSHFILGPANATVTHQTMRMYRNTQIGNGGPYSIKLSTYTCFFPRTQMSTK